MCDNGSTDGTRARFEPLAASEARLRYLRIERNRGTPAPARNLGIESATSDWVAFLDDDDRWLPNKLALQRDLMDEHDVVASDAVRSTGGRYFGASGLPAVADRAQIERANPVILSTCLIRRPLLRQAHGFDEDRRLAGAEDYDLLLRLADRGARFALLDEPTVEYRDHGHDRLSEAVLASQRALLRVRLKRWRSEPTDRARIEALARESYATVRQLARVRR